MARVIWTDCDDLYWCQILGVSEQEIMEQIGKAFVDFVSQYGYDRVLSVLGRHMRDFLNGKSFNLFDFYYFESITSRHTGSTSPRIL